MIDDNEIALLRLEREALEIAWTEKGMTLKSFPRLKNGFVDAASIPDFNEYLKAKQESNLAFKAIQAFNIRNKKLLKYLRD